MSGVIMPAPAVVSARHHVDARLHHERQHVGPWTIDLWRDPFAGGTRCTIHKHAIVWGPWAAVFHFARGIDSFEASYRVDDGPVISWRSNAMTLASHGVAIEHGDLRNPSAGQVPIPVAVLIGAHSVTIRPNPTSGAHIFDLEGLQPALAAAAAAGCPVTSAS